MQKFGGELSLKMKKNRFLILVASALLVAILVFFIFAGKALFKKEANNVNQTVIENIPTEDWLFDNCNCTVRERRACANESFQYSNGFCRYNNTLTYFISKCSEFVCQNKTYEWGYGKWEVNVTN